MSEFLLKQIPQQPLILIGDIHGEVTALRSLLAEIDKQNKNQPRLLVFVGDLCDRGPDSPAVIELVEELVAQKKALCILGNHEINLLANDAKDGSGWYFDEREIADQSYYAPFNRASEAQKARISDFFAALPLAIQTPDLRVVHAAWDVQAINAIARVPLGQLREFIGQCAHNLQHQAAVSGIYERYLQEKHQWARQLEDVDNPPPYLQAIADYEVLQQTMDPIKRLTSGIEELSPKPFFSGNRWRYLDRTPWWNQDQNPIPVVFGHYWRLLYPPKNNQAWRYSKLFAGVAPNAWHGARHQAFCLDYSVGARWRERKQNIDIDDSKFKLAAMFWPEKKLLFDDGNSVSTI